MQFGHITSKMNPTLLMSAVIVTVLLANIGKFFTVAALSLQFYRANARTCSLV